MAVTWLRLSETLAGPKSPDLCQACGAGGGLDRWREHDERDRPGPIVVVLCRPCSHRLIEPHPRLYGRLDPNEPQPGCMAICLDCGHRRGVACSHPDAEANGGPGVAITIEPPTRVHLQRSPRRLSGWITHWPGPALGCDRKEAAS